MAIIVEDGTIVTDANSYVSEAELTTYTTDRGITLTGTASVLLLKAMDYLERQSFLGYKKTQDQELQWPRQEVYINGYLVGSSAIPKELKNAQLALAVAIDEGYDPLAPVDPAVKREKVEGAVDITYQDGVGSSGFSPAIYNALKPLVIGGGGGLNFVVTRV